MSEYCEVCDCDPCDCYDNCEPEKPKMKYAYINKEEIYYVPRAPSFCQARERNELFQKILGIEPYIVGLAEWNYLTLQYSVEHLEVDDV
jgi:hypothetical protein